MLTLCYAERKFCKEITEIKMRIAIILGTRPEIIKMSPVIRACEGQDVDFFILHNGAHFLRV